MFVERKRVLLKAAALSALAIAALAGCGKKEEPAPAPAPAASAAAAPKPEPMKVAFVYIWTAGDAGWTFAHDLGRKEVEAEFGDKVKTTIVVLALISRNPAWIRINMPASLGRPFHPGS